VVKNGKIVGEGYHKKAGTPHAESLAIDAAGKNASGADLYVNLEPCCHTGRTPPCTDKIITGGIKKVVAATKDPNPLMCGKSLQKLGKAGIKTSCGSCCQESRKLNEIFFKNMQKKLPFVAAKFAQSLDGKIATRLNVSQWITSQEARNKAKGLRDLYDCVVVGVNTANKDNPSLNGLTKKPLKAVIDPKLVIKPSLKLIQENGKNLFLLTSLKNKNKGSKLFDKVTVLFAREKNGCLDLLDLMKQLYAFKICSLFIEGGAQTLGLFFDAGLVDKVYAFIAPQIIGGKAALSAVEARGVDTPGKISLKSVRVEMVGSDILVSGNITR
jgi:diaminohydroxyphosphoribosylaminopyrimidine deaminase/5-amino-6-(5-phosphoribosylamino)uracil reductase